MVHIPLASQRNQLTATVGKIENNSIHRKLVNNGIHKSCKAVILRSYLSYEYPSVYELRIDKMIGIILCRDVGRSNKTVCRTSDKEVAISMHQLVFKGNTTQ